MKVEYCLGYGNKNTNYTLGQFVVFNNLCASCGSVSSSVVSSTALKATSKVNE